jgi:integrase/recombinase XerD
MLNWTSTLQGFSHYLRLERALSANSIAAYLRDVQKLVQYLDMMGIEIEAPNVSEAQLHQFVNYLASLGIEASSQARIISGLKTFYKYLLMDDIIHEDPTALLDAPKLSRRIPMVLNYDEVQQILEAIDLSQPQGTRNRAMVETLYACGLRVSELVDLRLSNLFLDIGFVRVIGKGNKERLVPIGEEASKQILLYVQEVRSKQDIAAGHENIVFLNRRGKKLSRVMIFMIIKELAELAEIKKEVSPHTFRHSFATHLLEGGADLKAIQDMLGHESITTTEIYTHLDTDYLRETILMFHPMNRRKPIPVE